MYVSEFYILAIEESRKVYFDFDNITELQYPNISKQIV